MVKGVRKILFGFMLILPHILSCFVLILLFPEKWFAIIIVGLILPDISYYFYMFVHPAAIVKGDFNLNRIGENRKRIAHILTFIVIVYLIVIEEYVLVLAGGIHLFLDMLGF